MQKQNLYLRTRLEYTILEANSCVGGRIKNKHFCGAVLEEGANWVKGTEQELLNPIYKHTMRSKIYGKKELHQSYVVKDCTRPELPNDMVKEEFENVYT